LEAGVAFFAGASSAGTSGNLAFISAFLGLTVASGAISLSFLNSLSRLSGFMRVGDQFKPLPIGSTLDSKQGVFYWQPGPGFVGDYHLVFVAQDDYGWTAKKDIVVRIGPKH